MKKILYILALAAVSLTATVSCSKNFEWNDPLDGQEAFTLRFAASTMTKADVDGTDRENYVGSLQFFVFPVDASGEVADNTEYIFSATYASDAEGWTYSAASEATEDTPAQKEKWTFSLTKAQIATLFPVGTTQVKVFAVANYTVPAEKKTWKDINGIEVGATFTKDGGPGYGKRWPRVMQPDDENLYFIMTGQADVELGDAEKKILLARLASKVTVSFEYEEVTDSKGVVWKPQPAHDETRVYLSNAICTTTLGGPLTRALNPDGGSETAPSPNRDVFEYAYDFMNDVPVVDEKPTAHYYTYPAQLEVGDDNQPYLKLVLLWYGYKTINDEEVFYKQKEVYYKIALPSASIDEPNHIYEYNVKVNIIGSDKEVLLTPDYVVKDWTTSDPISANVATGMYISLEIPKEEYDMYTDEVSIKFVSSGDVVARIDTVYQYNYNRSSNRPSNVKDPNNLKDYYMINDTYSNSHDRHSEVTDGETVNAWVSIPEGTQQLKISHAMQNDINTPATFDAAPFVYVVTLHLVEDTANDFDRTVTITQYPAMYIIADPNTGYDVTYTQNSRTFRSGYTYVNTTEHVWSYLNNGVWYSTSGLYNSGNTNRNMYVVTSTILTVDDLILGDPTGPATSVITDFNGTPSAYGWVSAPGVEGTASRKLSANYRQAEASDRTVNMVAPKIRIASSFGSTSDRDYDTQIRRCAAYQEDGHPAGRWRLPTMGEINYLVNLSAKDLIPRLFGNATGSTDYWCANGYVTVNGNTVTKHPNVTSGDRYVRCVYDEWYWGSETLPDRTVFTWGDEYSK